MAPKTILVVDDSSTMRQLISRTLREGGFEVLEAPDGQAGAEAIDAHASIALVICDVNMPRMNGLEMVMVVKQKPQHAALPILMLTTEGQPGLIKKAKEAGARGWMVKPFNTSQLLAAVQKLAGAA